MPAQLCIPLEARLQPTFFVIVPSESLALAAPRLNRLPRRLLHDVPQRLSAIVERHPAEIEVRIYDPGTKVDEWLAGHVANCRGPQRLIGVHTDDLNMHPRGGLWTVLLTATMLARELGGEVYDPDAMRMVDLQQPADFLSVDGHVAVCNHITIPYSHGSRGRIWMTTKGMRKFGLPELEVRDLPSEARWFWFFLNGVAQMLVDQALETVAGDPGSDVLRLPGTLALETSLLFKACGRHGASGSRDDTIDVGLSFAPGRFPNGFVRILPPLPAVSVARWVETIEERLRRVTGLPSLN